MEKEQNFEENNQKNQKKQQNSHEKREKSKNHRGTIIGLSIATGVLGLTSLGLGIGYGVTQSQASSYSTKLDNIYKRNYYELVENLNSADMKVSKLLAIDNDKYAAKMLTELSQTSKEMQNNISFLPVSSDSVVQSVRFINQLSGFTQILEEKLMTGGSLSEQDVETLNEIHECLTEMKRYINQMEQNMDDDYSILQSSAVKGGEQRGFTLEFSQIKAEDADFPTMIYDGPFSDSTVNTKVKGLSGENISKDDAYKKVDQIFKNVSNIRYEGQTNGKFETYNFDMLTSNDKHLYVQVSKIGGNILTVSGNVDSDEKNIDFARAKKIALDFAKANGVEDAEVVWHEELQSQAYFNIAPKQDGVILYGDLVKVKVDMENADVIGYDAITYFTNHTKRTLEKPALSIDDAEQKISPKFEIKTKRLVLSPLDFNREVLCYEFECEKDGATYYFYINANTNVVENILKVVQTTDSSKLM